MYYTRCDPSFIPFLYFPDDCLGEVASWLALPEIPDFALVSKQFSEIVAMGHCLEPQAVQLFPKIGELRDATPLSRDGKKKSFGDVLKQQLYAEKVNAIRWNSGITHKWPMESRMEQRKRALMNDYSYYLTFELGVGADPTKDREHDSVVIFKKDAGVVLGEWRFPEEEEDFITLTFDISDKAIEFPPLWPELETFGLPESEAYKAEEERRRDFMVEDIDFEDEHPISDVDRVDHWFKLFVLNKSTGETQVLTEREREKKHRFDKYSRPKWYAHEEDEGLFSIFFDAYCCLLRAPGACHGNFCPHDEAQHSATYRIHLVEGAGGVPELRCKVEEISLRFMRENSLYGKNEKMDVDTILSIYKHLFI